jgi:uncharacterized membrane protein YeaQ/YmgE (transglycosylase-associated protein family)
MKGLKATQIFTIIGAVLLKNWIFKYYGLQYDVFEDEFNLKLLLLNIAGVIIIVILVSLLMKKLTK